MSHISAHPPGPSPQVGILLQNLNGDVDMSISRFCLAIAVAGCALAPATQHAQSGTLYRASSAAGVESAPTATLDDPAIVGIFDAANTWDVDLGALALRRSHDAKVRSFAEMMVRDHSALRKLGRDLAAKLGVTPVAPDKSFPLYKDHVAATARLEAETGVKFDRDYVDHEVWYHQAVIDAVTRTLIPATKNAELKDFELKAAPNFQAHLAAAKELQRKLSA